MAPLGGASIQDDLVRGIIGEVKLLTVERLKRVLRSESQLMSGIKTELQTRLIARRPNFHLGSRQTTSVIMILTSRYQTFSMRKDVTIKYNFVASEMPLEVTLPVNLLGNIHNQRTLTLHRIRPIHRPPQPRHNSTAARPLNTIPREHWSIATCLLARASRHVCFAPSSLESDNLLTDPLQLESPLKIPRSTPFRNRSVHYTS